MNDIHEPQRSLRAQRRKPQGLLCVLCELCVQTSRFVVRRRWRSRCWAPACNRPDTSGTRTIAVIPKGTSHVFWQSIHAGAEKAARELGVKIIWRGPLREDDRDSQVSEVEGFVSRGVSGIVLAPLDEAALAAAGGRREARRHPGRRHRLGAEGRRLRQLRRDRQSQRRAHGRRPSRAACCSKPARSCCCATPKAPRARSSARKGSSKRSPRKKGIEVVSANQYGGADVEGAYKKGEALLSRYKRPDGSLGVDGIFCPNESTTLAMLRVLQDNGWAGKVRFVGFDASDTLVKGLADGHLDGLVLQDPVNMGYLGVKTMVAHLNGQPVEKRIDTGVRLITRERMNDPDAKELLQPDLSKWLNP